MAIWSINISMECDRKRERVWRELTVVIVNLLKCWNIWGNYAAHLVAASSELLMISGLTLNDLLTRIYEPYPSVVAIFIIAMGAIQQSVYLISFPLFGMFSSLLALLFIISIRPVNQRHRWHVMRMQMWQQSQNMCHILLVHYATVSRRLNLRLRFNSTVLPLHFSSSSDFIRLFYAHWNATTSRHHSQWLSCSHHKCQQSEFFLFMRFSGNSSLKSESWATYVSALSIHMRIGSSKCLLLHLHLHLLRLPQKCCNKFRARH